MIHRLVILIRKRRGRLFPRRTTGQRTALLKFPRVLTERLERRPPHVRQQLLLRIERRNQLATSTLLGTVQVTHGNENSREVNVADEPIQIAAGFAAAVKIGLEFTTKVTVVVFVQIPVAPVRV